jgi:hypothetical protein
MTNRRIVDSAFAEHGVTPHIAMETDSIFALYSHVCFGGMASVVPRSMLMLSPPNVTAIDLDPPLYKQVGLLHLRRDPSPPLGTIQCFCTRYRPRSPHRRADTPHLLKDRGGRSGLPPAQ